MKPKVSPMFLLGLLLVFLNFSCKFTQILPNINYINNQETFKANPQTNIIKTSTIRKEEATKVFLATKIDTNKIKNVPKIWNETLTNTHPDNATKENIIKFSQSITKAYSKETETFEQNTTNVFEENYFEETPISNTANTNFDLISSKSSILNYEQENFSKMRSSFK
jgi:hypothetical protein